MSKRNSTVVVSRADTVLETAINILCATGTTMGPTEIASVGIDCKWLRVPRGLTKAYAAQTLQTKLQANATNENNKKRLVNRPQAGKYRARLRAY